MVRGVFPDSSTSASADKIRDEALGLNSNGGEGTDLVNLSSQYDACSYGKLTFVPVDNSVDFNGQNAVYGVITVNVGGQNVQGTSDGVIREAMKNALIPGNSGNSYLTSRVDYVLLCIPPGTSGGWIAYVSFQG